MPRLVAGGPGKRKFWHAWVTGKELTIRFGKLGTRGQEQVKSFDTEEAAAKELAKLTKQKLAKEYTDATWRLALDETPLELVEVVDRPPRPDDASLAYELVDLGEEAWSGLFWHGDYTLGLEKRDDGYLAGIIDRSKKSASWRPFDPPVIGSTFPSGFDSRGERFVMVAGGSAFVMDCKTGAKTPITLAGDAVVSAAALTRDHVAILRGKGKKAHLELYTLATGAWSLAKTIPCNRQDELEVLGDGRVLVVTRSDGQEHFDAKTGSWTSTHFLGLDGDVRLLGSFGMRVEYAFEKDGRSLFAASPRGVVELCHLDEALKKAATMSAPKSLG
jgi:predicted DNA-binding WGR domain protein